MRDTRVNLDDAKLFNQSQVFLPTHLHMRSATFRLFEVNPFVLQVSPPHRFDHRFLQCPPRRQILVLLPLIFLPQEFCLLRLVEGPSQESLVCVVTAAHERLYACHFANVDADTEYPSCH